MAIIAFERFLDFVGIDRSPTLRAANFLDELTRQVNQNIVLTGNGTPEAVISAEPSTLYMDVDGGTGTILYIKKSGAGDTGWVLV